ncbi:lachrymatory-factor synthase-like [Panicum miliaceum]|uniref:Lachrymatory-factor synthase-like n=1 Tax=Panicum miliaceum TaxID=4540 RepID=A0A3L6R113_PANMI|nr:lachrymatory-factor synthase-like [Panicum miliaceum]
MDGAPAAAWRGTVRAVASGPAPGTAWALLGDFFSLDRWVSTVRTCRRVEGDEEGRVRYCEGPVNMAAAPGEAAVVGWSKERLLEVDHAGRRYSYEVVESNKGFGRYRATMREGFVGFLEELARGVARRLEEEINVAKPDGV